MTAHPFTSSGSGSARVTGADRTRSDPASHRYTEPSVKEMTPADNDAQRDLVRASVLAKPA